MDANVVVLIFLPLKLAFGSLCSPCRPHPHASRSLLFGVHWKIEKLWTVQALSCRLTNTWLILCWHSADILLSLGQFMWLIKFWFFYTILHTIYCWQSTIILPTQSTMILPTVHWYTTDSSLMYHQQFINIAPPVHWYITNSQPIICCQQLIIVEQSRCLSQVSTGILARPGLSLSFESPVALFSIPVTKLVTLWLNSINNRQIFHL